MARFTSRTFKKYMSKKSKKSKGRSRKLKLRQKQKQKGGGDTFSRNIPSQAVKANPPNTSEYRGNDAIGNTTET